MHFEIIALNNSMLHFKIILLTLISSAWTTPLLHADLSVFTLAFFIHIICFLRHSDCIILAAPLYFWPVPCCWC